MPPAQWNEDPSVFESKPASFAPDIFGDKQKTGGVLRILTVDERIGQERKKELVRVPLFFHKAEASEDPNAFVIVAGASKTVLPYQADDIRRDASGKITRMHLYFVLDDLPAWGRKQFQLQAGQNPGAALPRMPLPVKDGILSVEGDDLQMGFHAEGPLAGSIAIVKSKGITLLSSESLGPSANLIRQKTNASVPSQVNYFGYETPDSLRIKGFSWYSGPLLAKVVVKLSPRDAPGDIAEYIYRVPRQGTYFSQTQLFYPAGDISAETVGSRDNILLQGKLSLGGSAAEMKITAIPATLRKELANIFPYSIQSLVNPSATLSLTAIPLVHSGQKDFITRNDADGSFSFKGSPYFQTKGGSNSGNLRVFFGETRFVFSKSVDAESLWQLQCREFHPLTAVVDEPWASREDLGKFAREAVLEYPKIQYWGKSFEANLVMDFLQGKNVAERLEGGSASTPDLRPVLPYREEVEASWKKGQGAGVLDPYTVTFGSSAVVPFSTLVQSSKKLDETAYRLGQAGRLVNGITTAEGWPNLRTFSNTANMKIGTYLCAIQGGKAFGDAGLQRWGRDAAGNQNMLASYGHAQRPYNSSTGVMEASDELYLSVTDFWLRAIELCSNENLMLHPAVYGRYFDMIDVNADIYQGPAANASGDEKSGNNPSWWRATFLRGQAHDHRWEAYGCDPYLGVLGKASDQGKIGITESCYFMQKEIGRKASWNQLMSQVFFPAVLTESGLDKYRPILRLPLPQNIRTERAPDKNIVHWDSVPQAQGYRIYKSHQPGGPWTWLNSPYPQIKPLVLPGSEEKVLWEKEAESANVEKAHELGIDPKKLKGADKTAAWNKRPQPDIPSVPDTLAKGTSFEDRDGKSGDIYFITAEDKEGRESSWFPLEPLPASGNAP